MVIKLGDIGEKRKRSRVTPVMERGDADLSRIK
jgi:hypothetical protein